MSGSQVYTLSKDKKFFLGGFMCESNSDMNIIYASHAAHIKADGTLKGLFSSQPQFRPTH